MKRFARVALLAVVPLIGAPDAGGERASDRAMAEAMQRCEAALVASRTAEAAPAACAAPVAWKLYVPKSKRVRPILVLRNSLIA